LRESGDTPIVTILIIFVKFPTKFVFPVFISGIRTPGKYFVDTFIVYNLSAPFIVVCVSSTNARREPKKTKSPRLSYANVTTEENLKILIFNQILKCGN